MWRKRFILIHSTLFCLLFAAAQCPNHDSLWNQLIFLRDHPSAIPPSGQLKLLSDYEVKIENCPYKFDSVHSFLLRRIAKTYMDLGDYLAAVNYLTSAVHMITANSGKRSTDRMQLVMNYFLLGKCYEVLNKNKEKADSFDSCASIGLQLKMIDKSSLWSLYTQVEYCYDIGDYVRCINYASECENLGWEYAKSANDKAEYGAGLQYVFSSLVWRVNSLLKLENYKAAETILLDKINECKREGLRSYFGSLYDLLAETARQKGDYEQALSYYQQALRHEKEVKNNLNCKTILKNIGFEIYYTHLNNTNKALEYYRKALLYKDTDAFESLSVLDNIGQAYARNGVFDLAFKYFQLAFDQIKPGCSEKDLLNNNEFSQGKEMDYLANLVVDKANAYKQIFVARNDPTTIYSAINSYKVADGLLEKIKTEQTELESKLFWRSHTRNLYENAIDACYLCRDFKNAFYFFEKSRAVLLQDQLTEQRWLGDNDILKQAQIRRKIQQLKKESDTVNRSSSRYSTLQNELFSQEKDLDRLEQAIKARDPLYFQNFLDKTFITVENVQQHILRDHSAFVELFTGDSAVYVLAITAHKFYFDKIEKRKFDSLTTAFLSYISDPDLLNKSADIFFKISNGLYRLIFQNINLPIGSIIISPDAKYFPFEALVTTFKPQLTYFLQDYPVSYAYSARYLLNDFAIDSMSTPYTFMGIAPVQFSNGISTLIGSDQSLRKVQSYFTNATSFVGTNAKKNVFLSEYYKYRIIQLYTHASDKGPLGVPIIYFSDSILSLSDLFYQNKPATSLIVLSACETAGGKLYNGEGVFSFNRQFAALGIPSSITNVWSVENESTYRLTELFYKYLIKGISMDVALQKAKLDFINTSSKEKRLPYYWAAPLLIGKNNSFEERANNLQSVVFLILAAIVIALVCFFIYKAIPSKNNLDRFVISNI